MVATISKSIAMVIDASPLLLQGAIMTAQLWITATLISITIGTIWGVFRSDQLRQAWLSTILDAITFVLKGVPFYVQLLITYFVLPEIVGINLSATTAGTITLGLCSAAYLSQIIRGGINAIPLGQWEAAKVLGYTKLNTVRYIIIPQMLKAIIPSCAGELDQLLKSTAVISAIGVLELTGAAKNIIAQEMNPLTMYLTIAVIYLALSSILNLISAMLERKVCT